MSESELCHPVLHYRLHSLLTSIIPAEATVPVALYSKSIYASTITRKNDIDLPSIGADGIDPELVRYHCPESVREKRWRQAHSEVWFRFYAFKGDEPFTVPADLRVPKVTDYASSFPSEYVLVVPVERPPHIVQYNNMTNGDPNLTPRYPLTEKEAVDFINIIPTFDPPWSR